MYSPVSCYVPSDRVHEIVAIQNELSKDFGCHPGQIHISNDILSCFGNTIVYVLTIGPLGLFFKLKEGKTSFEKIKEDYEEERRNIMPPNRPDRGILPTEQLPQRRRNPQ